MLWLRRISFTVVAKSNSFVYDNLPVLPLNLWDGKCCNRPSFEFEPLAATGSLEPWRSGGKFLLLPLKLQNFWWGTNFVIARDWRRVVAGVLKGGSCPYDSEVVDSASAYGLRLLPSSKNSKGLDEELLTPPRSSRSQLTEKCNGITGAWKEQREAERRRSCYCYR